MFKKSGLGAAGVLSIAALAALPSAGHAATSSCTTQVNLSPVVIATVDTCMPEAPTCDETTISIPLNPVLTGRVDLCF